MKVSMRLLAELQEQAEKIPTGKAVIEWQEGKQAVILTMHPLERKPQSLKERVQNLLHEG